LTTREPGRGGRSSDLLAGGARTPARKRLAVMQPYFFPYAGYFGLLAAVDEFVIFDCVQFPRRGRVHRTEVPSPRGGVEWLTLPLADQPRAVLIRDLAFAPNARERLDERLARHRWVQTSDGPGAEVLRRHLYGPLGSVIDFLARGLRVVAEVLDLDVAISHSTALDLDPRLRGQERVIAVAASLGATHYVNAPGGRDLYEADRFARAGIELSFLRPYQGNFFQLLPALMTESPATIRRDVLAAAQSW
jgi:hypothetical protein